MNKYLLFTYTYHEEKGGMNDYIGRFNEIQDAINYRSWYIKNRVSNNIGWGKKGDYGGHIFDVEKNKIIITFNGEEKIVS